MKKIFPLIIILLFVSIICGACSEDDFITDNEKYIDTLVISDTTFNKDTIIKRDTIINNTDTIIQIDTIVHIDTVVKTDSIVDTVLKQIPIADPFIILHNNTYYAYGTANVNLGFPVYTSDNLMAWEYKGYALSVENTNNQTLFWAPEVYNIEGRFYMFYASNRQIYLASAGSPLGPFKQITENPVVEGYGIDPSLFIDDDGKRYLTYTINLYVFIAELNEDMKSIIKNTRKSCFKTKQDWEKVERGDNEGSFLIKHKGLYYMTYSGNKWQSQHYGVGVGISNSVLGPWTKVDYNPILQFPQNLVGTGHHSFFRDKEGKLKIVFHAHYDKNNVSPRQMYISDVYFEEQENAPDKMVIDTENIITPLYYKK